MMRPLYDPVFVWAMITVTAMYLISWRNNSSFWSGFDSRFGKLLLCFHFPEEWKSCCYESFESRWLETVGEDSHLWVEVKYCWWNILWPLGCTNPNFCPNLYEPESIKWWACVLCMNLRRMSVRHDLYNDLWIMWFAECKSVENPLCYNTLY